MIEKLQVTGEMEDVFTEAAFASYEQITCSVGAGLQAVLALIVERYRLIPICRTELTADLICLRDEHGPGIEHEAWMPSGGKVKWS